MTTDSCNLLLLPHALNFTIQIENNFLQDYLAYSDNFSHPTCLPDNRCYHYTFSLAICSYRNHTAIDELRKLLVGMKRTSMLELEALFQILFYVRQSCSSALSLRQSMTPSQRAVIETQVPSPHVNFPSSQKNFVLLLITDSSKGLIFQMTKWEYLKL